MARNEKIKRKRNKFYLKKGDVVKTYYTMSTFMVGLP